MRLDPAWIAAVQPAEAPAQAWYRRLAQRLEDAGAPRPQLLLLIGDQVYVDDTAGLFDADGSDDPAASYLLSFRMPALRNVTSALPSIRCSMTMRWPTTGSLKLRRRRRRRKARRWAPTSRSSTSWSAPL